MIHSPDIIGETHLRIPTLRTRRLVMRAPEPQDLPLWTAFLASARTAYIGGPKDAADAFSDLCALIGHWQQRGYGRWMLTEAATGAALGSVGLYYPVGWPEPEIAWTLFETAEGKGYALEAALATRAYAYDTLGFETLVSCVLPGNTRSVALAERMGARFEGHFEHAEYGPLEVYRHLSPAECVQ